MPAESQVSIKIGADPEVFLTDPHGQYVSAFGIIPGTKKKPHPVTYGAIQVDGVAAEFNIDPCTESSEFTEKIRHVMESLKGQLPPGYGYKIIPTAKFDEVIWSNIPNESKLLGCDPDYNAWTGQVNPPPATVYDRMRTGAGHIHVGFTSNASIDPTGDHFEDCRVLAQQMDYYLGVYSLLWDTDSRRRTMYGKAGAFRPKPYGIEYRTPSNMWLKKIELQDWVFTAAYSAVHGLITGQKDFLPTRFGNRAQEIIDGNQTDFVKSSEFKAGLHRYTGLPWPK